MVIFEGEELLLHYHEGTSDYILITFASADQTDQAHHRYFLQPIAEKYQLSCLGITTKIDNFYQHSDMHHIIPLCNEITQNYQKVIIIGLSMGAYAALKFSAELHANIVFAMGARYTLDASVASVCGIMQRTVDRLDPYSIQETTIHPHEVSGKLYIVHDTYQGLAGYNDIDHQHVYQIIEKLPNTVLVPVLFAHHLVVNSLKGSEEFKSILDILVTEDDPKIIRQVVKIRRHHIYNIYSKIVLLINRYPLWIYKLLISKKFSYIKNNDLLFDDYEKNLTLIYLLKIKGHHKESRNLLQICFLRMLLNCSFYEADQTYKEHMVPPDIHTQNLPYLIAHNGFMLVFDQIQKKMIVTRQFVSNMNVIPVRLCEAQGCFKLVCIWEDMLFELKYREEIIYLVPLHVKGQAKDMIVIEKQEHTAMIYTLDHQLCFYVESLENNGFHQTQSNKPEQFAIV
ncbi:hypothetical protein HK18_08875 [Commensalibacter intestini]|uniref:Alpha/beta hydrolase n=1 Tax=Commensalibacter intestini TaxID=479936 RepID=A0A251ZU08_9PROT|nr:hypothetical protein [Commensalibacter intestini]OUI78156.1 hypothetical protein HK18_08875 [Commensalibacter intestini]